MCKDMPRKDMFTMSELIMEAIPVNSTEPITEIAYKAGTDWRTAKRWIELMRKIQAFPEIIVEQIGDQEGYRRKTLAGRPKKK